MSNANRTASAGVAVVAMMLMGIFAIPSTASAGPAVLTDQLETETGGTDILGGGDHFFVKFGTDAAFGVVWGNETNENNVYFVAIKARYLGVAQVYDRDGDLVEADHPIKVYTMYAVKLDSLVEFSDVDGNGVLAYQRLFALGNFTGVYSGDEPIYKKADLKTSWTQSEVVYAETDYSKNWTFDLTATDLPYVPLKDYSGAVGDDMLNTMKLSFHLEANMVQMNNETLPQYRITVTKGPLGTMAFYGTEKIEDFQVAGKVIKYDMKWDQQIEGWDFDADNTVNKTLLLEFGAIVGNWMSPVRAAWMEMNMVRTMNENGAMTANEGTSTELRVNESLGVLEPQQVRTLTQNRLAFDGEWSKIGAMHWVTDVEVDGVQEQLHAQVMAGVPIVAVGPNKAVFAGFAVLGGMAFPGGGLINHDPTFESEALVDVSTDTQPGISVLVLMAAAVIAIVVVVAVVAVLMSGKKPGQKVQQNYEKTISSQPGEWSKYYNKK
jgi:hypothetical protein